MVKQYLSRLLFNIPGWRTNRKIVVIESDDWGSIRMPSKEVYQKSLQAGYPVDQISYERYDSIASEEDLELLFDLLTSFKDKNGQYPVITSNCLVANPNFEKIIKEDFRNYHYELITETFKKYPNHRNNFKLWKQGMEAKVFHPQYHGREHLNVSLLMEALQRGDQDAHFGFANQMPGSIPLGPEVDGNPYVEALRYHSIQDKKEKLNIFLEGLALFEELFGYRSKSIIPPNYTWSPDYNEAVMKEGVRYFQGIRIFREPVSANKNIHHRIYLGKKNDQGQTYLVRNALFEPSILGIMIKDSVSRCLSEMNIAFRMNKPAVISSHRINYVGFLDVANRDQTLIMLREILKTALKRWPDIEFMTSDHLGSILNEG